MISIVVVTRNRRSQVLRALDSAFGQTTDEPVEVVVVDNGSSDGTVEAIRTAHPDAKVIALPENLGCPAGRNAAYAHCSGEFIVNLDDDGFLDPDVAQATATIFRADPSVAVVNFRQEFPDHQGEYRALSPAYSEVNTFWGGVSAFRRSAVEEAGWYPGDFFLYAEEMFLTLRLFDLGYRIVSAPAIAMFHPKIGSSESNESRYHRYLNSLRVIARLFPAWLLPIFLPLKVATSLRDARRRGCTSQLVRALRTLLAELPRTLATRRPCRTSSIFRYYAVRRENRRRFGLTVDPADASWPVPPGGWKEAA